jgi:hypothetical protein
MTLSEPTPDNLWRKGRIARAIIEQEKPAHTLPTPTAYSTATPPIWSGRQALQPPVQPNPALIIASGTLYCCTALKSMATIRFGNSNKNSTLASITQVTCHFYSIMPKGYGQSGVNVMATLPSKDVAMRRLYNRHLP